MQDRTAAALSIDSAPVRPAAAAAASECYLSGTFDREVSSSHLEVTSISAATVTLNLNFEEFFRDITGTNEVEKDRTISSAEAKLYKISRSD